MTPILHENELGVLTSDLQIDDLNSALLNREGLLWLDCSETPAGQVESILSDIFNFHPLAIDDALHQSHVPKVNNWQEYLYIVLRAASYTDAQLVIPELDNFLGANYIVTYSKEPIPALDRMWEVCRDDQLWTRRGRPPQEQELALASPTK